MKRDFFRIFSAKGREEEGRANPLFPATKTPRWKKIFLGCFVASAFIAACFGIYRYASNPSFMLSNIELNGVYTLDQAEILSTVNGELDKHKLLVFTGRQRWFFNEKALTDTLEQKYPLAINSLEIDEQTLRIGVTEDITLVALETGNDWSLVSLNGNIVRHLTPDEIPLLTKTDLTPEESPIPFNRLPKLVLQLAPQSTDPGVNLFSSAFLPALMELDDGLKTLSLTAKTYVLETVSDPWVSVNTNEKPYRILVDLKKSIADELLMLKTVMSDYNGKDGALSYIDVRFGNHVYVK